MTADDLIAEARENRAETKYIDVRQSLHLVLTMLLEACNYEEEMESPPAVFARSSPASSLP